MANKHVFRWGNVSRRLTNYIGWVTLFLLIPVTLFIVLYSDVSAIVLLGWLMLAIVTVTVALMLQLSSFQAHHDLVQAREHHESERGQLVTILNSMSVGIMSVKEDGTIRLYNAALLALLDTNDSITGKKVSEVFQTVSSADKTPVDLMNIAPKTYMTRNEDLLLQYTDGEQIRLGVTINPVHGPHSQLQGYIYIVEDITKQKSLEEERDEFISVISHELRTPITIVEGSVSNAQLLLSRGAEPSILKKTFDEAHSQVVYLANMVNDLGTLSRAERGVGDELTPIDIDALAADLHNKYEPRARERKLHLNLDVVGHIGTVNSSRLYLEEVLQNFITNSIKYTQEGSVTLHIRKTGEGILFAVKDTGIGISKADQRRIFEKFYRSEDYRTRETSGTGLGLYVVQKLAHKLGVTIEVTSRLNHGSTFSFTLPLK